ncbi:MAG: VWA domain-containing protein [Elusimicrobiota bacterium]|jgi:Ca-activated chloride channel family protein|nr:VWA domain-containing protein [Elusimicrobiota bacterium]
MRFANFTFLILGVILLAAVFWFINFYQKSRYSPTLKFPRLALIKSTDASSKIWMLRFLQIAKYASLILILIALARPQKGKSFDMQNNQGIDIMIALDTSTSMSSIDFKPDRMEAAKTVVENFVKERKYDRIGLVNFAGLAFTQCPLTTDKQSLLEFIQNIKIGDTGLDGTAIGSAIITSVNRLKDSKAKSKVIILVTDGNNNMGEVDPLTASQVAAQYKIKIYAIAVGSLEGGIYVVDDPYFGRREVRDTQNKINESVLRQVAQNTQGQYYRALDGKSFENIMKQIDALEKTDIQTAQFTTYNEIYKPFVILAMLILLGVILLENTYLRVLP